MKSIKLLLIGFLSTISLFACGDNINSQSTSPLRIVADIDNGTPELYDNATIMIKTIDINGSPVKSTWRATGIKGVDLSFDPESHTNSENITVKITDKTTAKGVIIAQVNIDGVLITASFKIVPSTTVLKSINVSPVDPIIKLVKNKGSVTLSALATFKNDRVIDITKDIIWSMENTPYLRLNPRMGIVTATGVVNIPSIATGSFTSGSVIQTGTSSITTEPDIIAKIEVTVDNDETSKLPKGAVKQLKAMATYLGGSVEDITSQVLWTTSKAEIIMVDSKTGIITGAKSSGSATLRAKSKNNKEGDIKITGSVPELISVTIKLDDIVTTHPIFATITAINSDGEPSSTIDASDFKWKLTLVGSGNINDIAEINEKTGEIIAKDNIASTEVKITATLNNNAQPQNISSVTVEPIIINIKTTP